MSNHLKNETSPYLLQHAENPVDWYPWCREAFEKARKEDKPVFLSIGYSTCHWCHVMAHESFEDPGTAEFLNRYFISVKVDREERPDIDSVYMSVCQAFTGSGGWPMSIFMTWDKKPFLAGTYFPVRSRYGMPGFTDLLKTVADHWRDNRKELLRSADQIIAHLKQEESGQERGDTARLCGKAVQMFSDSFDRLYGGFGNAPKFPVPHNLLFLTLYTAQNNAPEVLEMVEKTLIQMRKGGIFDQIGYGFSRYSTDRYFLAPHFEKMLYDNALLIMAYASVYHVTRKRFYLDTAEKTAAYVLREMTSPEGGFYSAQDADSEGTEGKYYTFTLAEVVEVLGEERGKKFADVFDITAEGNFEGVNIPNLLRCKALGDGFGDALNDNPGYEVNMDSSNEADNGSGKDFDMDFSNEIQKLYDYRKNRFRMHLDDKILTSWNSMMIAALSMLYRVSRKEEYLQAAIHAAEFLEKNLGGNLCLYTSWRGGKHSEHSFLDDYAFYAAGLTELYHSTLDRKYLEKAERCCQEAVRRFIDDKNGGFFLSDADGSELFMNPKETYDGAVPSGNSVMAYNFVRLYQLTGREDYRALAEKQISYLSARVQDSLTGHGMFLLTKLLYDNPPEHIVIVLKNDSDDSLKDNPELEKVKEKLPFLANVAVVSESREYPLINDRMTFYVCKNHVCFAPSNTLSV